jgi:photosystem II stability/assembly factor-like uncharacterized protein
VLESIFFRGSALKNFRCAFALDSLPSFLRKGIALLIGLLSCGGLSEAQRPTAVPYAWKNVQIVGGGFVDGIIFHPTIASVRYARTDMGGAYRWDAVLKRWSPILDWMPYKDLNLMGVESIAIDPSDPNRVYLACGTYTNANTPNGAILRSNDRASTFQRTDVPFKFGGNEDGRGNGERMAVDPIDGRVLYLGTRHDGLWRSRDRGATWARVTSFPDTTEAPPQMPPPVPGETPEQHWQRMPVRGSGIIFVKFAGNGTAAGKPTGTIYVGVSLMGRPNLFVSHDAGATWQPIVGEPTQYRPTRAAMASDGALYIAYGNAPGPSRMTNGAVWKFDTHSGKWTDITPDRPIAGSREFGYAAIAVDAHDPHRLIASSYNRYSSGGEELFRSTDGGASWKPIFASGGQYDYTAAPYVKPTAIHWLFDIEIDPTNPDHAMFTTGYGGWETFDLRAADRDQPTHWSDFAQGIEETVGLELASPLEGAHLISAIGDYGGFTHWDLDRPAPAGASAPPRMGNTTGLVVAALNPKKLVRVGENAERKPQNNISYSLDGGRTWSGTSSAPTQQSRAGSIAISADGNTWVWTPQREDASVTNDRGATWKAAGGLPPNMRVIADTVNPHVFFAYSLADHVLYRSEDDAVTFIQIPTNVPSISSRRGDARGGQDHLYATSGMSGDLWFAAWDGLYHTTAPVKGAQPAVSFARMPGVDEIHAFGFGKAAPGKNYPALYLVGTVGGLPGIFRSVDQAHSWVRINDDQHQWGLVLQIAGDPRIFGRAYVGTHGRGIFYGDSLKR